MGIRFLCEHCNHRLNVKQAQAGQLGLCLHCRKTIRVPNESTLEARKPKAAVPAQQLDHRFTDPDPPSDGGSDDKSEILDVDEQITMEGLTAGDHFKTDDSVPPAPRVDRPRQTPKEVFELGKPSPPKNRGRIDPIADQPDLVWYFRSRMIGERGPLRGKDMQTHVDQGDVDIGSLVWREDWDEWLKAEDVFPSLAAQAKEERQRSRLQKAMDRAAESWPDGYSEALQSNAYRWYILLTVLGLLTVGGLCLIVFWMVRV